MSDQKITVDSFDNPIEKFSYLAGMTHLSWDDCCDAWLEAKNLIPEIAPYIQDLKSRAEKAEARLEKALQIIEALAIDTNEPMVWAALKEIRGEK